MNTKVILTAAAGLGALVLFGRKDANLAKELKKLDIKPTAIKFKDTVGIPLTKGFKARFYLEIYVFNPLNLTVPLAVKNIILNVDGKPAATLAKGIPNLEVSPQANIFQNVLFEMPITVNNVNQIFNGTNKNITLNASIYNVPFTVTKNVNQE
jgi:hypothetical protein